MRSLPSATKRRATELMEIARRIQPHLPQLSKPVRLSWDQSVNVDDFASSTPKTGEELKVGKISGSPLSCTTHGSSSSC
jgi:hypothetical protein